MKKNHVWLCWALTFYLLITIGFWIFFQPNPATIILGLPGRWYIIALTALSTLWSFWAGREFGYGKPRPIKDIKKGEHVRFLSVYQGTNPETSNWYILIELRDGTRRNIVWWKDDNRPTACLLREGYWYSWDGEGLESIV